MTGFLVFNAFLIFFLFALAIFLFIRNYQTSEMLKEINELCFDWGVRNSDKLVSGEETSAYEWIYYKLPSYEDMLLSMTPLKKEYWIHEEDLKKLLDGATK